MKHYSLSLFILVVLFNVQKSNAQQKELGRLPEYPVAYLSPEVDSIKEVLNRIRLYYEATSKQQIVNAATGQPITDFSVPNKDARVSGGFASEWGVYAWCGAFGL